MQGFVSGIGHRESKRLYEKCASTQTSWMTSCAWRIDSKQCFTITFQSFANGIRLVTELLLPKFIQNFFPYAQGSKVHASLCILLKDN